MTMDYYHEVEGKKSTSPSILQSDELFSSKILGRQSTIGSCSSRIYSRGPEGVPFQWEMQPGKPITPQSDHILPPISPPPAVLAMGLRKPCIEPKAKRWSRAWLAKKIKRRLTIPRILRLRGSSTNCNVSNSDKAYHNESERYLSASARFSSSSFASMSRSSSSDSSHGRASSKDDQRKELSQSKAFTCNPRGFSDLVVYLMRRG